MRKVIKAGATLFAVAVVLVLQPLCTMAQQAQPAAAGFSFAVYGDSRSMFYLPYRSDQEAEARQLMVQMFELVFPRNIAERVNEMSNSLTILPLMNWCRS